MKRRTFTKLAALGTGLSLYPSAWSQAGQTEGPRLFFGLDEMARIRTNAKTTLLAETFNTWKNAPAAERIATINKVRETADLLSDFSRALVATAEAATVYLIEPTPAYRAVIEAGLDLLQDLPDWDYFLDKDGEVLGIMRASKGITTALFALEVLGDTVPPERRKALLRDIAEKGCLPCARAIEDMNHAEAEHGWTVTDAFLERVPYDMSRWPAFFNVNNLRAIPTMGLGLGALALAERDERASEWLDLAVASAQHYLRLHETDGSYYEGLSYVDYAFRTMFLFLEAYNRIHGDIDWTAEANFPGITEFIAAMQMGRTPDGSAPDIVNISDARNSVFITVPAWIARHTGDPVAHYATEHFARPGYFADFLWYAPGAPSSPPPDTLLNKHFDLDWIVCRTGWAPDDAVLAFRSGAPSNHEHADRNHITFKAHGERLLTDPFGASYDPRLPHWLLRLPQAHNAVLVDGQGHQYHDGKEGTNAGLAEARILRFKEEGDAVWWSSDVTQGYQIVNPNVQRVMRTVLFLKPNIVVLFDEVTTETPATVDIRFHPDNRDDAAQIAVDQTDFILQRPRASLHAYTRSTQPIHATASALDLPETYGHFPFANVQSAAHTSHRVLTLLITQPQDAAVQTPVIETTATGWHLTVGDRTINLFTQGPLPDFNIE